MENVEEEVLRVGGDSVSSADMHDVLTCVCGGERTIHCEGSISATACRKREE